MSEILPWLPTIFSLMVLSAFCSGAESACFSLSVEQLNAMKSGTAVERRIARMMNASERLLSCLLLTNLVANMFFFAILSVITLKIQQENVALAGSVSVGALLSMIVFCELLPKSLAVLMPLTFARLIAFPLSGICWVCKPILPVLQLAKMLSLRLLVPNLRNEPILHLDDLERAVNLSQGKGSSTPQDKALLHSLVALSRLKAEEMMRPRRMLPIFLPPLSLDDLRMADRSLGMVFVQECVTQDAIWRVFHTYQLPKLPKNVQNELERYAEEAFYVPWNLPVSEVFDMLYSRNRNVAIVVDEHGATPGVILRSDIMETIFAQNSERVFQLTDRYPIHALSEDTWEVSGLYSVRDFCRFFKVNFPEDTEVHTVGGLVTEILQRLPISGDVCHWNGFAFRILSIENAPSILIEVRKIAE